MKVYPTPSEAISHGACAVCLGGGETFDIVLDRLGRCSVCGGSGLLTDMLANQCTDPECPEHHPDTKHIIELTYTGWTIQHPLHERVTNSLFDCGVSWTAGDVGVYGRFNLEWDEVQNDWVLGERL